MDTVIQPSAGAAAPSRAATADARPPLLTIHLDGRVLGESLAGRWWQAIRRAWFPAAVVTVAVTLLAVVQSVLPGWAALGEAKMPLLSLAVVYAGLHLSPASAVGIGVFAGLLQDALSALPIGVSCVVYVVLAGILARHADDHGIVRTRTWVLAATLACAGCGLAFHLYAGLVQGVPRGVRLPALNVLGTAAAAGVLALPFSLAARRVRRVAPTCEARWKRACSAAAHSGVRERQRPVPDGASMTGGSEQ